MNNQNEKESPLKHWSQEMKHDWDERARQDAKWFINTVRLQQSEQEFDETGAFEVQRLVLADLELLTQGRDPKTLRLLELGCGIGRMTKHLAPLFAEIYAVDVSGEMINQARKRLQGLKNVYLYETSGCDLSELPSNHFDIAFSAFVFQHVPSASVIASNLYDIYRVLKPGGIFKFQTNSITSFDFEEIEKDTWTGASFPASAIREFARATGAQILSIYGAGMQYCWTMLRKRTLGKASVGKYTSARPQIERYGRVDNLEIKQIPTGGDGASIALIATGLMRDAICCNSVIVEIGGLDILPRYVGPIKPHLVTAAMQPSSNDFTQIEIELPIGIPADKLPLRLRTASGETSPPVIVEFVSPQPVIPRIGTIMNGVDYGADIYACGPKSRLRLHVEGLDEAADTGNIRLQVGQRIIKPCYVGFLPGNGLYQVDAQLPDDIEPGPTELRIYFGNLASPAANLDVLNITH